MAHNQTHSHTYKHMKTHQQATFTPVGQSSSGLQTCIWCTGGACLLVPHVPCNSACLLGPVGCHVAMEFLAGGGGAGSGGVAVGLVLLLLLLLLLLLDSADIMEGCDISAEASPCCKIEFMNLSRCSSSCGSTGLNNCVYAIPNPPLQVNNPWEGLQPMTITKLCLATSLSTNLPLLSRVTWSPS